MTLKTKGIRLTEAYQEADAERSETRLNTRTQQLQQLQKAIK